ncbi:MAG: SxtJ family membrane protein [Gallionella sp.]
MSSKNLHEDLSRQSVEEKSSERGFGVTFAVVFFIIGFAQLYQDHDWWATCFFVAVFFLFLAYFWVAPLRPLNKLWHRLGLLLSHLVTPIAMGIVFYLTIFPIGVLMRLFEKDPLKLKLDHEAPTYWQERAPSDATLQNMKNQF